MEHFNLPHEEKLFKITIIVDKILGNYETFQKILYCLVSSFDRAVINKYRYELVFSFLFAGNRSLYFLFKPGDHGLSLQASVQAKA